MIKANNETVKMKNTLLDSNFDSRSAAVPLAQCSAPQVARSSIFS